MHDVRNAGQQQLRLFVMVVQPNNAVVWVAGHKTVHVLCNENFCVVERCIILKRFVVL